MSELPSSTEWRKVFYVPHFGEQTRAHSEAELRDAAARRGLDFHAWPGGFVAFEPSHTKDGPAHAWVWDTNGRMTRSEFLNSVYVGNVPDEQTGERLPVANFAQVYTYDAHGNLASAHQVVCDIEGGEELYRDMSTGRIYVSVTSFA